MQGNFPDPPSDKLAATLYQFLTPWTVRQRYAEGLVIFEQLGMPDADQVRAMLAAKIVKWWTFGFDCAIMRQPF